jgi:hypothetical protein
VPTSSTTSDDVILYVVQLDVRLAS